MTAERPIDYDVELYVVTAWNGAGTPVVFSSKENCEQTLALYEALNKDASMPWTYDRGAVNGDRILDLFLNGLRPWKVTLGADLKVLSCRIIPLHHITLKLVTERYDAGGAPRCLEVWAPTRDTALAHTNNMLTTNDKVKLLYDLDKEWSFNAWVEEQEPEAPKWGAKPSTPGLDDEVDFYSDEQKEKWPLPKPAEQHVVTKKKEPAPPVFIPGFGTVLDLGKL